MSCDVFFDTDARQPAVAVGLGPFETVLLCSCTQVYALLHSCTFNSHLRAAAGR